MRSTRGRQWWGREAPVWRVALALGLTVVAAPGCPDDTASSGGPAVPDAGGFPGPGGDATDGDAELPFNVRPSPPQVAWELETPTTVDDLTVVIVEPAWDPDSYPGELETLVTWYRDDEPTPHTTLGIGALFTARGDRWRAEITSFDGRDRSDPVFLEVEVANAPPTLEVAPSLGPVAPSAEDALTCDAGVGQDADSDDVSLTIDWVLGQSVLPGVEGPVLAPPLEPEGVYRCRVTPFDGQASGDAVLSNPVTVAEAVETTDAILLVQPPSLDLGTTLPGETKTGELIVSNIGEAELIVTGIELSGDLGFAVTMDLPVGLSPGESTTATVAFATDTPGLKKGTVAFETNASNAGSSGVPLFGIGAAPCLKLTPPIVDFGGVYVPSNHTRYVDVESCGALPLVIDSVAIANPDLGFELSIAPGPGPLPWTLGPGEVTQVRVDYAPTVATPLGEDGAPMPSETVVSFLTNGSFQPVSLPVTGFGSDQACPVPVIDVYEGAIAGPGTTLHLSAAKSFAPGGPPKYVQWAVVPPSGEALLDILPDNESMEVEYTVGDPGVYTFQLSVFDEDESTNPPTFVSGCFTATYDVLIKDAVPLIVELGWTTPGDADPSDFGAGLAHDLDLHVAKTLPETAASPDWDGDGSPDPWFDWVHDVFWLDTSPEWGEPGPDDDPVHVTQVPVGPGPERVELALPANGETYTVAVHSWSDYAWGPALATVRVYHFEELVFEATEQVLNHQDLWEVVRLPWPKMDLQPSFSSSGGPKVTSEYPNPFLAP